MKNVRNYPKNSKISVKEIKKGSSNNSLFLFSQITVVIFLITSNGLSFFLVFSLINKALLLTNTFSNIFYNFSGGSLGSQFNLRAHSNCAHFRILNILYNILSTDFIYANIYSIFSRTICIFHKY